LNGIEQRFTNSSAFLGWLNPLGEWGVDLFFIISGFVMITSTWHEFATPAISGRFFLRRLTRIYPAYWIAMLPILALYLVAPHLVNGSQVIRPSIPASLLLFPQVGKPLLTVSWTLVYEMFFYVVFALVLAFDRRFCLPLLGGWGVLTLLAAVLLHSWHNPYFDVYANPLLLEFIFGVLAGYLVQTRGGLFPIPSLFLGLAGIAVAVVFYNQLNVAAGLQGELRFLCIGVPVWLIFNGVIGFETRFGLIFPRSLQAIGNASYSLYLWHVPLSILAGRFWGALRMNPNPALHALWLGGVIVFVVGSSLMLYTLIERPMLRVFGRWLKDLDERETRAVPAIAEAR
jgi:exopolysaccharide production protein ExoZ